MSTPTTASRRRHPSASSAHAAAVARLATVRQVEADVDDVPVVDVPSGPQPPPVAKTGARRHVDRDLAALLGTLDAADVATVDELSDSFLHGLAERLAPLITAIQMGRR